MKDRTLTFGLKLGISTGILVLVIAFQAFVGLRELASMESTLHRTADVNARKIELAGDLNAAESDMAAGQRGVILFTFAKEPAAAARADTLFQESNIKFQRALAEMQPLLVTEHGKQ